MFGLSTRMVTSTTTTKVPSTAMSTIPTGAFGRYTIPKFYNYWWLRSPGTNNIGFFVSTAWYVASSGVVNNVYNVYDGNIGKSYGRIIRQIIPKFYKYWWLRSPHTNSSVIFGYSAGLVKPSGDVDNGSNIDNSYGRRSPDSFMYYNYTSFYVIEDGSMITYAVEYFYG